MTSNDPVTLARTTSREYDNDGTAAMPPEIADSDAESDIGSPVKQAQMPKDGDGDQNSHASLSVIDFDQFLDPTQRLSSSATNQTSGVSQLDGAGDSNIQADGNGMSASTNLTPFTVDMSPAAKSKKRAHSALLDDSKNSSHEAEKKSKTRRSKTYGTASKSRSSLGDDVFAPSLVPSLEAGHSALTDVYAVTTTHSSSTSHAAYAETNLLATTTSSGQNGETSHLGTALSDATPLMTTSLASMGQYQSINLDFRGGLDVNANPFGSLSQVSLDADPNQAGMEHLANAFGATGDQLPNPDADALNFGFAELEPLPAMPRSSPTRPLAVNPALLMQAATAVPTADADIHSYGLGTIAEVNDSPADIVLPSTEKPAPKKRGRKAKNSTSSSKSRAPSQSEDVDELALANMPPPNRSRLGTVDSVSQASEASGPISSTRKRKRGKSKQLVEEAPANPAESSPVKQSNGDLDLSDESIIGLPKEGYKPRPSRSRSNVVAEEVEGVPPKADNSSPLKPQSSGTNLSDEAAVGLPKEMYKPRPSRSRSKHVGDEGTDLPAPEPEHDQRTPAKSITINVPEEEPATVPSTKSSTKKGRKAKVKRAKTSAAALLKRTDPMLSEGEDDVVWMETMPAPVKLDLPPALKALKQEADPLDEGDEDVVSHKPKKGKADNITIEIPVSAEVKNPAAEPKKRGRKPKKAAQKSAEKIVDEDEDEEPLQGNNPSRPALAENSTNIPASIESPRRKASKKTPTVSPLTSPEPEAQAQSKPTKSLAQSKANNPLTSPAKPKPTTSTEKGPTKHSPIAHLTASSKKTIYRVGLSRRQNIPSLLRKVDREKRPVKNVAIKQKERKVKKDENFDGEEGGGGDPGEMRGADGMLVEWEF